jgi:undecaprenyl-diphosphatase
MARPYLNLFVGKNRLLDGLIIFAARWLPFVAGVALVAMAYYKNRASIFLFPLLAALVSRFIFAEAIYLFWKRKRPATFSETKVLIPVPSNPSFPSAHASFFFAAAFTLFYRDVYLAIIFLIIALIVSLARVAAGIHWFGDIVAGFVNGLISALVTYYFIIPWILHNLFY